MKLSIAAAAALLVMSLPFAASAQVDDGYAWGFTAGAAIPVSYLQDDHNTGVNAGITFAFGGVGSLFGVRVDGMLNRFGAKSGTEGGNARITAATANIVYSPFSGGSDRFYLPAGVGAHRRTEERRVGETRAAQ